MLNILEMVDVVVGNCGLDVLGFVGMILKLVFGLVIGFIYLGGGFVDVLL